MRVVAPDVGGGFGAKLQLYGEEVLVLACSKKLGRPVKYVETRSEHMTNSHHGRDQIATVTLTAKKDGTVTGCKAEVIADTGAYHQLLTPFIAELGFPVAGGCYKFPAIDFSVTGVFTNKMPTDAIRGAGRPEATYWVELMMDKLARELDMDPLELRRKNFVPKEEFPYETPLGIVYDSGDYHGSLDKLLENFDLDAFRKEQAELKEKGIHRGVGLLHLGRGLRPGPVARRRPAGRGPAGGVLGVGHGAGAPVRLGHRLLGRLAARPGPGHLVRADRGRPAGHRPRAVDVIHGDTDTGPFGWGTYGSRSLSVGGEAIARAAEKVQDKAKKVCAAMLEAAPEDIELANGTFRVKGSPDKSMTMAEISGAAHIPPQELPADIEPAWRRPRSTTRRTSCSRSARTRASSTWTPRPGRSRSSTTTRSTTAARPSTRCHRGPGPRRHRARHRPGPLRAGGLRRGGPAGHRHVRGLRAAHRGGAAVLQHRPHGDPVAG